MLIEKLTWPEFKKHLKKTKRAIIPIGPIEEHGPHITLASDFTAPYELAKKVAQKIDVFVLPAIPLGVCRSTANFTGTMSISQKTLIKVIEELCEGLIKHKINKILILNGHAGSLHLPAVDEALKNLKKKHPRVKFLTTNIGKTHRGATSKIIQTLNDSHAGEIETSRLLFLKPEIVRKDKVVKEIMPVFDTQKQLKNPHKYWKYGVDGDAKKASYQKGKTLISEAIKNICTLLS